VTTLFDRPIFLFVFSVLVLWLSVQAGAFVARKMRPLGEEDRADLDLVINGTLTLLALIIGFSFSMAVSRYDQRKNYEEEEANAIGTEYVRADLLSTADRLQIQQLLRRYTQERLLFYTVRDQQRLDRINEETSQLQNQMWSIVARTAAATPTVPMGLVVSGMNDVLNRQGYTQAAWWNRIPVGAWSLMVALALCSTFLIGFASHQKRTWMPSVLPFVLAVAFFLIADIDSPRRGSIRVLPQNLMSLAQGQQADLTSRNGPR
jgi:hypothetical protein